MTPKITRKALTLTLCLLAGLTVDLAQAEKFAFYHLDALGSPVAATDEVGNLLWREDYTPYGERIINDPAAVNDTRWYTGHVHDQDTGLTYMGARYYDPSLGRFMGVDSAGFQESIIHSFNRYSYGNNNPYRYIDPDGKAAFLAACLTPPGAPVCVGVGQLIVNTITVGLGVTILATSGDGGDKTSPSTPFQGETSPMSTPPEDPNNFGPRHPAREAGLERIPRDWGPGRQSARGPGSGWRWFDSNNPGNNVRIQMGSPNARWVTQREPYVQLRSGGRVIGRDGKVLPDRFHPDAHIPLREWLNWPRWNSPI